MSRSILPAKRVAVIGTGSSAIQSIPIIARQAAQLYVFQRTANYSIPAHNRPLDPEAVRAIKADYGAMRARAGARPRASISTTANSPRSKRRPRSASANTKRGGGTAVWSSWAPSATCC